MKTNIAMKARKLLNLKRTTDKQSDSRIELTAHTHTHTQTHTHKSLHNKNNLMAGITTHL
jgi:hypothetical protein